VRLIENDTTKVIDASTAYRVADGWAYGFAEMDKDQSKRIATAKRVTNPGCWPQGAICDAAAAGQCRADPRRSGRGRSRHFRLFRRGRSMIEEYEQNGESANAFAPYGLTLTHKHSAGDAGLFKTRQGAFVHAGGRQFPPGHDRHVPLQLSTFAKIPTGAQLHAAIADHYAAIPDSFVEVAPFADNSGSTPNSTTIANRMRLHVFANDQTAQAV